MHIRSFTLASILIILFAAKVAHSSGLDDEVTSSPSEVPTTVARTGFDPKSHSMAKSVDAQRFIKAIGGGEFEAAKAIFEEGDDRLKSYCGMQLANLGSDKVIDGINRDGGSDIKTWILQVTFAYASQELIDDVLGKVTPSDELLTSVAHSADLAGRPERFTNLLEKIASKDAQRSAVQTGVAALFDSAKTKSFDPLLRKLGSEKFSDPTLADAAVIQALFSDCNRCGESPSFAIYYYDHYALSADHYSQALLISHTTCDSELFGFLLTKARREDLEAFMNYYRITLGKMPSAFQEVMDKALVSASPQTRMEARFNRTMMIEGILQAGIPLVIIKIIWGYDI